MSYWYDRRPGMSMVEPRLSLRGGRNCRFSNLMSHFSRGCRMDGECDTRMRNWLANLGDLGGLEVSRATETASVRLLWAALPRRERIGV
jgi:hypothetical protein